MMRVSTACGRFIVFGLAAISIAASARDLPLVDAAKRNDVPGLRGLLKQGADVNSAYPDGTTALLWAAYWDDDESADLLIRAGAKVDAANDLGVTPLSVACENGSASMVDRLLRAGANPNAALLSGETPLMRAARTGNAAVVKQLLAKGAEVNAKERVRDQTALMWAVAQRHPSVVEALLARGADVHARSNVWTQTVNTTPENFNSASILDIQRGGNTPLLFAAQAGDLASAVLLLAAGANVNDTAPYGTSALVVAAHSGHGELATLLLEKGADPNAAGAGYTALHAAVLRQDEKLVAALLAHGANASAPLASGTPTRRGSKEDVYLNPAFVGATPFWLAARFTAPRIMRRLAEHGADPRFVHHVVFWRDTIINAQLTLVTEGNTTALMAAIGMGHPSYRPLYRRDSGSDLGELEAVRLEAVKVAAELGVDVNAANADGDTALHAAAARGYDTVVTFLIEKGAGLNVRNKKGQTPLALALAGTPRKSITDLLQNFGATQ